MPLLVPDMGDEMRLGLVFPHLVLDKRPQSLHHHEHELRFVQPVAIRVFGFERLSQVDHVARGEVLVDKQGSVKFRATGRGTGGGRGGGGSEGAAK